MSSRLSNAIRSLPVLSRLRRRRARKPIERVSAARHDPQQRPAKAPLGLTLSSRRIPRQTMPDAVVPYLRMSGRRLEEHGFAVGAGVQVLVEQGRVTLVSPAPRTAASAPWMRDPRLLHRVPLT
jgi:hypothetical protein